MGGAWPGRAASCVAWVAAVAALAGCHGAVVRGPFAPNHDAGFDLRRPPCEPQGRPSAGDGDLLIRYLGVGGVFIEWHGASVLTAPLFTRYGPLRVALGAVDADAEAITAGLEGLPLQTTHAVLVGHSHYDHIADLPHVLLHHAPHARVFVNRSGARMLAAFAALRRRMVVLEEQLDPGPRPDTGDGWIRLATRGGRPLPIRILPLVSRHAPHLRGLHFAEGDVKRPWTTWDGKRLRRMREGTTYAFLIDLLAPDSGETVFRIHYQDAAGIPSRLVGDRPVDIAILTVPSHHLVKGYPEAIVRATRSRHVMLIHYEDFLRERGRALRFAPLLTDRKAERFFAAVAATLVGEAARAPEPCGCGPCGPSWSMPLPGEWLRWPAAPGR